LLRGRRVVGMRRVVCRSGNRFSQGDEDGIRWSEKGARGSHEMQWTEKSAFPHPPTPKLLGDREGIRLAFCASCLPHWNSTRHDGAALLHCTLDILWRCHYCCGPAAFPVSSREWQLLMERKARYIVRFFFLTASRLVSRGGGGAHERRRWSFFFFFSCLVYIPKKWQKLSDKPFGEHDPFAVNSRHRS
jgi:hypothetical protein